MFQKIPYLLIVGLCISSLGQEGFALNCKEPPTCADIEKVCKSVSGTGPHCNIIGGCADEMKYKDPDNFREPRDACYQAIQNCHEKFKNDQEAMECICLAGLEKLRELGFCKN